jgi:hypothetical protein
MMFVNLFQSVTSKNPNFINDESNNITSVAYKNYFNCKIRTSGAMDGRVLLFPGLLFSIGDGANVKRSSGTLIAFDYLAGSIYFDNDEYRGDFRYAVVFWFNGYIHNYFEGPWKIFDINGTALIARVSYN